MLPSYVIDVKTFSVTFCGICIIKNLKCRNYFFFYFGKIDQHHSTKFGKISINMSFSKIVPKHFAVNEI